MLTALHFLTHIGLSWIVASLGRRSAKDRWLITLAGVLPDFDGVGILWSDDAYVAGHRAVGHGLVFALVWLALTLASADARASAAALGMLSFHLHLLLDLVGTGGLPIRYWWPWSAREWSYPGRWTLASWPNTIVMIVTLLGVLGVGWRTRPSRARAPGSGGARRAPRTTTGR
jgi:inner membrane protein